MTALLLVQLGGALLVSGRASEMVCGILNPICGLLMRVHEGRLDDNGYAEIDVVAEDVDHASVRPPDSL